VRQLPDDLYSDQWRRDLMGAYSGLAAVRRNQGDLKGALESSQGILRVAEELAARDPHNSEWQHDLTVGYANLGDTQAAQGDTDAALKSYLAGLSIAERLGISDPHNARWQNDIASDYAQIAAALGKMRPALLVIRPV
jgi:tetratricopeptide (TPR) repeat protein